MLARMTVRWALVAVVVAGCGKKDEPASAPERASAPAPAPAPALDAAVAAAPRPAGCEGACARRGECGVDGAADQCVTECKSLLALDMFTAGDLDAYATASCDQVTMEPGFQSAAVCQRACEHRASCLPDPAARDVKRCLAACAVIGATPKLDRSYTALPCPETIAQDERFQVSMLCVEGCTRALACGVEGTAADCISDCGDDLTRDQRKWLTTATCDAMRAEVHFKKRRRDADTRIDGEQCRARGIDDCEALGWICCSKTDPAATREGDPGFCMGAPVCVGMR